MTTDTLEAPATTVAPVAPAAPAAPITATSLLGDAPAAPIEATSFKMPGKDATPEAWNDFYKAVGRPETAEAYELPLPEGDDGKFAAIMKPMMHKHGLSAEQAKGLAADWNTMQASNQTAQNEAQAAADVAAHSKNTAEAAALTNEWGVNNAENMEHAKRGIAQFVPGDNEQKGSVIAAIENVLGYKETIKFFHGIGKGLADGGAAGLGDGGPGATPMSIAEKLYGRQT